MAKLLTGGYGTFEVGVAEACQRKLIKLSTKQIADAAKSILLDH